eukprot:UN23514
MKGRARSRDIELVMNTLNFSLKTPPVFLECSRKNRARSRKVELIQEKVELIQGKIELVQEK